MIRNKLPKYPITLVYSFRLVTRAENTLPITTNTISLAHTPATKLKPPVCPLVRLCFMMVNITGPTERARIHPSVNPLIMASNMLYTLRTCAYDLIHAGFSTLPVSRKRSQSSYIFPFITRGNLCWPPIFPLARIKSMNFDSGKILR